MAQRLYIGPESGSEVIRVSKPGFDAETTGFENLILGTDRSQAQIAYIGSFALSAVTTTVALPTNCTGCRLFVRSFNTVRSPVGVMEFVRFTMSFSGSNLVVTITHASTDQVNTYMPPNFVNFTRTLSVLILKE